jgi:hypothetical protein
VLATSSWAPGHPPARQQGPHQQATALLDRRGQLLQTVIVPVGVAVEVLAVDVVGVFAHVLLLPSTPACSRSLSGSSHRPS